MKQLRNLSCPFHCGGAGRSYGKDHAEDCALYAPFRAPTPPPSNWAVVSHSRKPKKSSDLMIIRTMTPVGVAMAGVIHRKTGRIYRYVWGDVVASRNEARAAKEATRRLLRLTYVDADEHYGAEPAGGCPW